MAEIPDFRVALAPGAYVAFAYTNHRGEWAERRAKVHEVFWGATEWHPEPGFLLKAFDLDRQQVRLFAMKDMTNVRPLVAG